MSSTVGKNPDQSSGRESAPAPEDRTKSISSNSILATAAFAMQWSFMTTCLIFPVATQEAVGPTLTILPALCGLAAFTAVCFIRRNEHLAATRLSARSSSPLGAALSVPLLSMMAASAFGLQATPATQAVGWLLWGIGQAIALPAIGRIQAIFDRDEPNRTVSPTLVFISFACVALFGCLSLFAPDPFRSFLPAIYLLISLLCAMPCHKKVGENELRGKSDAVYHGKPSPKALSPLIVGATFSLLLCYCITYYGMSETLGVVSLSALIGAGGMLLVVWFTKVKVVNSFIERCYFPVTAFSFFLISVLPGDLRIVPACIAASMFFAFSAFHWSLLIALTRRSSQASAGHFSYGLLSPGGGLCIGWATASAYALAGGNMSSPFTLFFGWIVAYIIVLSIAPYASDPTFEIDMLDPDAVTSGADDRSGNSWERACGSLAERCGLSPREQEVFTMLARGRNVEHIAETLVISGNTAKTHKYRIYRKLEVTTHQELLDTVEREERQLLLSQ